MGRFAKYYEESVHLTLPPEEVFNFIDDHAKFSEHMNKPSLMLGKGKMEVVFDDSHGRAVGSHIRLTGNAFGIKIYLDEMITRYEPPLVKIWETVGDLQLLVIGRYEMGFEIKPMENGSHLRVFIDYDPPKNFVILEKLFGKIYAKWCVRQMLKSLPQ